MLAPVRCGQWVTGALAAGTMALAGCGSDRSHSPTCGLALLVAPTMIQQRLTNAAAVLTDAPRGLPATLPARVVFVGEGAKPPQGEVLVAYSQSQLVMGYQWTGFPSPPGGYGLLVVDDSTQRAEGVLIYESPPPRNYPQTGTVTGGDRSVPLYGVRVDWPSMNNPRCPLLGAAPAADR
jgi:hypothetical protein